MLFSFSFFVLFFLLCFSLNVERLLAIWPHLSLTAGTFPFYNNITAHWYIHIPKDVFISLLHSYRTLRSLSPGIIIFKIMDISALEWKIWEKYNFGVRSQDTKLGWFWHHFLKNWIPLGPITHTNVLISSRKCFFLTGILDYFRTIFPQTSYPTQHWKRQNWEECM